MHDDGGDERFDPFFAVILFVSCVNGLAAGDKNVNTRFSFDLRVTLLRLVKFRGVGALVLFFLFLAIVFGFVVRLYLLILVFGVSGFFIFLILVRL